MEEFTFRIDRCMTSVEPASEGLVNELRRWLGRNEKRFMCILEHHYSSCGLKHALKNWEEGMCFVNWLKVYRYINILGLKVHLTLSSPVLWDVPLEGTHTVLYNARFRYRKGWVSKRESVHVNGKDLTAFLVEECFERREHVHHRIREEILMLSDYVVSTFFSSMMRCEKLREIMV